MERTQFTFYRSYYEAVRELPKKEQTSVILAICTYALDEKTPDGLTGTAKAIFSLIKPTLDTSRRKAEVGAYGGRAKANAKQNDSKVQAETKQNASEIEREKEVEVENEKELEIEDECPISPKPPKGFEEFWDAYPRKSGKGAAEKAYGRIKSHYALLPKMLSALEVQKQSEQWTRDGGQYIPNPATWLNQRRWEDGAPKPAQAERQGQGRKSFSELIQEDKSYDA